MKIEFVVGKGSEAKTIDWALPVVPRVGEYVQLDHFQNGSVRSVHWVLADDSGFAIKDPYAIVILS